MKVREARAAIATFLALAGTQRVFFCTECDGIFEDADADVLSLLIPVCPECKDKTETDE